MCPLAGMSYTRDLSVVVLLLFGSCVGVSVCTRLTSLMADLHRELWEIARSHLRLQLPQSTYDTWVRDTVCVAHEDGAFVIGVCNAYARDWLELRLRRMIKQTLASIVGHAVDVNFIVQTTPAQDAPDPTPAPLLEVEPAVVPVPAVAPPRLIDLPARVQASAVNTVLRRLSWARPTGWRMRRPRQ